MFLEHMYNALHELKGNAVYENLDKEQSELYSKLESLISLEAIVVLRSYVGVTNAVDGMEFDRVTCAKT